MIAVTFGGIHVFLTLHQDFHTFVRRIQGILYLSVCMSVFEDIPVPVVSVGDRLKVWFPVEDEETTIKRKAAVTAIKRCKKIKHDSWYQYTLQFDDNEEQTTRLLHLQYKISKKTKKRSPKEEDVSSKNKKQRSSHSKLPSHHHILAPMVGGSELAFRLLCRRYGCDLAYTPMINSQVITCTSISRRHFLHPLPSFTSLP